MQRIQLEIGTQQDEKLVAAWMEWFVAQEMAAKEKCLNFGACDESESPLKRQRSLAAELPSYTAK